MKAWHALPTISLPIPEVVSTKFSHIMQQFLKFKIFLKCNTAAYLIFFQIAQTLFQIMLKLRDLGHPDYLTIKKTIRCGEKLEDTMIQVCQLNFLCACL